MRLVKRMCQNLKMITKSQKFQFYIIYHILYIIKVGLRRRGCITWLHQIVEILTKF